MKLAHYSTRKGFRLPAKHYLSSGFEHLLYGGVQMVCLIRPEGPSEFIWLLSLLKTSSTQLNCKNVDLKENGLSKPDKEPSSSTQYSSLFRLHCILSGVKDNDLLFCTISVSAKKFKTKIV